MNSKIFDKSKWKKVTFGDIAVEHKETIDKGDKPFEFYVGLDHIDTNSLHLSRWGNLADGVSFSKVFRKGHILFGRRRSYQKKAVIAPFDGVCSSDILVFEPKKDIIAPNLFPFFVQNERFFDFAMKTSAGSLSPRTKFKDLAAFTLLLPPLDQQKDLADLLWGGEKLNNRYNELKSEVFNLYMTIIKNNSNVAELKPIINLESLVEILDNKRIPLNGRQRIPGPFPYYGANGIVDNIDKYIFDDELVLIAEDGGNFHEYETKSIAYKVSGKCWVNNHAHVLKPIKEKMSVNWLYYQLVHKNIIKSISGTTRYKLNKSELKRIKIYLPNLSTQKLILINIMEVESALKSTISNIDSTKIIMNQIINEIVKT